MHGSERMRACTRTHRCPLSRRSQGRFTCRLDLIQQQLHIGPIPIGIDHTPRRSELHRLCGCVQACEQAHKHAWVHGCVHEGMGACVSECLRAWVRGCVGAVPCHAAPRRACAHACACARACVPQPA